MKTVEDYQKEFDTLNNQMENFKRTLPYGLSIVGKNIIQDNFVYVIRTESQTSRYLENSMKETADTTKSTLQKLVVSDEKAFEYDLNTLYYGLAHKYTKSYLVELFEDLKEDGCDLPTTNLEQAILDEFKSEEFKALFKNKTEMSYLQLFRELCYLKLEKGMNETNDVVVGIAENIDNGDLDLYGAGDLDISVYGEDWDGNDYDYKFRIYKMKESEYINNYSDSNNKSSKIRY